MQIPSKTDQSKVQINITDDEEKCDEGTVLVRTHKVRKRNSNLVKRKKERGLKYFRALIYEVCGLNF